MLTLKNLGRMRLGVKVLAGLVIACGVILGQDYRPGHLWVLSMRYNPAVALGSNWDIYGALNYRQQWANLDGGFVTYGLEAMVPVFGDDRQKFDVGLSVLQDQAGAFKVLDGRLGLSYTRFMGEVGMSVGLLGGYINRQIDPSGLTWGDQYVAGLYLEQVATSEVFGLERVGYPRLGAGLSVFRSVSDGLGGTIGLFVDNLNSPDVGQLESSGSFRQYRYVGQLFMKMPFGVDGSYVGGGLYVWYEGGIVERSYGLQVRYNELVEGDLHLFGTFWYRVNRSYVAGVGVGYRWVDLYYSYELPAGQLAASFAVLPVHEVSLSVRVDRGIKPDKALPMF